MKARYIAENIFSYFHLSMFLSTLEIEMLLKDFYIFKFFSRMSNCTMIWVLERSNINPDK